MLQLNEKPVTDWTLRNLRTVSTHLTVQEAEELKAICTRHGTKPYRLLHDYLLEVIHEGRIERYLVPQNHDHAINATKSSVRAGEKGKGI